MNPQPFEPTQTGSRHKQVEKYDLTQAQLGRKARPATLAMIEDRVANLLAVELATVLRAPTAVEVGETHTLKWREWAEMQPAFGVFNYLDVGALGGHGLLSIDAKFLYLFLQKLFGASEDKSLAADTPVRSRLSRVEERVVRRIVHVFGRSLESGWRPVVPLTVRHARVETKVGNAAVAQASDWVMATEFVASFGEERASVMLVLPVSLLEPHKERLASGQYESDGDEDGGWADTMVELLPHIPVELVGELGRAQLPLSRLLSLQPGDVLRLDQAASQPIIISVDGVPKYTGDPTVSFGNLAVELRALYRSIKENNRG